VEKSKNIRNKKAISRYNQSRAGSGSRSAAKSRTPKYKRTKSGGTIIGGEVIPF